MKDSQAPLPAPTVDLRAGEGGEWTEEKVRAFFCNPVYAGIGGYPQMVDDETWIRAAAQSLREDGPEQWLVNMLYALRLSIPAEQKA
ncbi:hypothetical protein OIU34_22185 [Pararhizobium sp. BT-229]|uniref:hypothetical protein n=1 Tax=Pararhizobium sp. BT-229 TaxID=2986923 RepID=UPI0021F6EB3A|nr:hypothetical protein [Pararhizobium sp. BT-229]MCV9964603.1 hypothetical protein [Pararhizobium sp. BT-229]